jgi:hypothetical protein
MTGAAAAAGMAANLCVESHLRELLELGFEVAVVRDATAGPTPPEGDGYLAALINYRYIANALWSTAQTVEFLKAKQVKREQAVPRDAGTALPIRDGHRFYVSPRNDRITKTITTAPTM